VDIIKTGCRNRIQNWGRYITALSWADCRQRKEGCLQRRQEAAKRRQEEAKRRKSEEKQAAMIGGTHAAGDGIGGNGSPGKKSQKNGTFVQEQHLGSRCHRRQNRWR